MRIGHSGCGWWTVEEGAPCAIALGVPRGLSPRVQPLELEPEPGGKPSYSFGHLAQSSSSRRRSSFRAACRSERSTVRVCSWLCLLGVEGGCVGNFCVMEGEPILLGTAKGVAVRDTGIVRRRRKDGASWCTAVSAEADTSRVALCPFVSFLAVPGAAYINPRSSSPAGMKGGERTVWSTSHRFD